MNRPRGSLWRLALLGAVLAMLQPALAIAAGPVAQVESDSMVLVVGELSPVTDLDAIDLKRLFLGIPVMAGGTNLHAVLNFSDARLRDLFHQHVAGMTSEVYERRLLELTLEQGRRMPATVADSASLLGLLQRDPLAVSFAWRSQVAGRPGVRIVRELWHP